MLRAHKNLRNISFLHRNLSQIKNYGAQYSQRCDVDECDCVIPKPKCEKRPKVVREVNCEKCIFECWEYKPRQRYAPPKTQDEIRREPRNCNPGMKDPNWRNLREEKGKAAKCHYLSRVEAPIAPCSKIYTGKSNKACLENPFKFENEHIPAADWDYTKKSDC